VKIRMGYPDAGAGEEEALLLRYHEGFDARALDRMALEPLPSGSVDAARRDVQAVRVEAGLFGYVAAIARRTREWPAVALGASPRAAISLLQMSKAMAAIDGRDYLLPDDVKRAAVPVLRHRVVLRAEADLEGLTADQVLADVLDAVEVPR